MFESALSRLLKAPAFIGMAIALVFVFGLATLPHLRVDLFPPLNFPVLNIITEIPSFSSLEMERQVTLPIESALSGVLGVTRVRSTSATGISQVTADFEWGTDMLTARQMLLESLSTIRAQLPSDAEPSLENLSATLAMIEGYSFQGGDDLVQLRDLAVYALKPRLQRLPGVYKFLVMGGKVLEYAVSPNPYLMVKYDLTLEDIKDALESNNILVSPGVVNRPSQELVLHANGQFADASEIAQVVIAVKSGQPIQLQDVARVIPSFQYERGDTSEGGKPAVLVNIYKQPRFDTETVAREARQEIAAFQETLPQGFSLSNYYDQAQLVHDSIGSVKESVWFGALLVVLVLAAFLRNVRATLIAALSIPLSVIAALVLMHVFGIGMNIMSLGGLAIGTGIIVDDAIVVLENIFRWLHSPSLRGPLSGTGVVARATAEVLRPVVFSTLTNIGIFLPMVCVEGFAGRLFSPVSWTVTFALLASLVVALTVIPVLAEKWVAQRAAFEMEEENKLHQVYRPLLQWSLRHPKKVLILAAVPVMGILLAGCHLDVGFLPALDEGAILASTLMPPGVSLTEARRLNLKIEDWLKDIPGVVTVVRRTGHTPGAEDTDNVNHSDIMVKLRPKNQRLVPLAVLLQALKAKTAALPSVQCSYLMPLADKINDALGGLSADLGVDLFGPDLVTLHQLAGQLVRGMEGVRGIVDLRPPADIPVPSLEVIVHKQEAGRLGISERTLHNLLEAFSSGLPATRIREVQKEIGVVLHLVPVGENLDWAKFQSLPIKTAGGSTVPLEQVADLHYGQIPSEILHERLNRKLIVSANVEGRRTAGAAQEVAQLIKKLQWPAGYSWGFSGKYQTEVKALSNMALVLALAILVVAIILWIEFRSAVQVGLILLTLPLAAMGTVISLWLCREAVNVSSMMGSVMLVGIVVRNGIMLLDYMNRARQEGQPWEDAIRIAALKRVRPILMTASVTVLGLVPLATGWGTGAELQRPLAIAVIGGIVTSTALTLILLPAAMLILKKK